MVLPTAPTATRDVRSNWRADNHPRPRARKDNLGYWSYRKIKTRQQRRDQTDVDRARNVDVAQQLILPTKPNRRWTTQHSADDQEASSDTGASDSSYDTSPQHRFVRSHSERLPDSDFELDQPIAGQVALEAAVSRAAAQHEEKIDKKEYEMLEDEGLSKRARRRKAKDVSRASQHDEPSLAAIKLDGEDDYEMVEFEP